MKPNFLFVGPDKSGSTWLYEILRAHPQAFVPLVKDIYFFDRFYDRGLGWYEKQFAGATPAHRAVGEICHDYLFSETVARRIAHDLPGIRLITSLRNPSERTFSHYLYLVRNGKTTDTFETALESMPELVNNSLYYKHLKPYFELFPASDIKVVFFDDLETDARGFARSVFEFLGIDWVEDLPYEDKVLPASRPRSVLLASVAKQGANAARSLGLTSAVGAVKKAMRGWLYTPYSDNKPKMSEDTRKRLDAIFLPDIEELERLLGVDLQRWKSGRTGTSR